MYGVLLSECCTDRHRQHARRGLDGSAAVAAGGRLQQKNGITRHILWEAAAAAVTQRQQRQALHKIILLLYYLLALAFSSSFTDTCKITFTCPKVSVILYTETFVYPEFHEGLPKLFTVPACCKH